SIRRRTTPWAACPPPSGARSCAATRPSSAACSRPARSRACPCTARTGSARTRCSTSTCSASGRAPLRPRTRPPSAGPSPPGGEGAPDAAVGELLDRLLAGSGGERVATLRRELQESMDAGAQVFRTAESLTRTLETIRELKARYADVTVHDKSRTFNTDLMEAV